VRTTLMLILTLLIFALRLPAQEGDPGADIWLASTSPSTVDGCLRSSGGHYSLKDKDGTIHNLAGNTARLSHFVGHEVEISGKPTIRTLNTTETQIASTAEELPALEVQSAKQISETCNSATP
jgi:hypothetical protein